VADVNGDGHPDLLVADECAISSCTNASIGVLLDDGDATFQTANAYNCTLFHMVRTIKTRPFIELIDRSIGILSGIRLP
jgi:hypothetical protein